jgi:hypothetical protein
MKSKATLAQKEGKVAPPGSMDIFWPRYCCREVTISHPNKHLHTQCKQHTVCRLVTPAIKKLPFQGCTIGTLRRGPRHAITQLLMDYYSLLHSYRALPKNVGHEPEIGSSSTVTLCGREILVMFAAHSFKSLLISSCQGKVFKRMQIARQLKKE